ncbi:hypothetical protein GC197_05610 [bacterium]|nr:hypothetical protein [bacterium]
MRALLAMAVVFIAGVDGLVAQEAANTTSKTIVVERTAQPDVNQADIDRYAKMLEHSEIDLDVADAPLNEVLQSISERTGIPIRIDGTGLKEIDLRPEEKVSITVPKTSTEIALRLMLDQLKLGFEVEPTGLLISAPGALEKKIHLQTYNVKDLLETNDDLEANPLLGLITTTIDPNSWDELGGPGTIAPYHGCLQVTQSRLNHRRVKRLLDQLRRARDLSSEEYQTESLQVSPLTKPSAAFRAQLQANLARVDLHNASHEDTLASLTKDYGDQLFINWQALVDEPFLVKAPISIQLQNVTQEQALDALTDQLRLTWFTLGNVIVITTPEDSENYQDTRVYPIRDLVWHGLNTNDPQIQEMLKHQANPYDQLDGSTQVWFGCLGTSSPYQSMPLGFPEIQAPNYSALIDNITTTVEPDSWDELGGPGTIGFYYMSDCLVVKQTQKVHRQVATALAQIRANERPVDAEALLKKFHAFEKEEIDLFYYSPVCPITGKQQLDKDDLQKIANRTMRLIEPESWQPQEHFIDVTARGLSVRNRRYVQREVLRYLKTFEILTTKPSQRVGFQTERSDANKTPKSGVFGSNRTTPNPHR